MLTGFLEGTLDDDDILITTQTTLMNLLNEVINVTFERKRTIVSLRQRSVVTLRIRVTVSLHTNS